MQNGDLCGQRGWWKRGFTQFRICLILFHPAGGRRPHINPLDILAMNHPGIGSWAQGLRERWKFFHPYFHHYRNYGKIIVITGVWITMYFFVLFLDLVLPLIKYCFFDSSEATALKEMVVKLNLKDLLVPSLLFILVDTLMAGRRWTLRIRTLIYNFCCPLILILLSFNISYDNPISVEKDLFLLKLIMVFFTVTLMFVAKLDYFNWLFSTDPSRIDSEIGVKRLGG